MENGYKMFNWKFNPFTFKIIPSLFVGYENESKSLMDSIDRDEKITLLIGPTGSGKTTLLKYMMDKLDKNIQIIYLSKPPRVPGDWIMVFAHIINSGILSHFRKKETSLYSLSEEINRKLKRSRCLLIVDECHEASIESLEWLRSFCDQITDLNIILSGLAVFENSLMNNLETLKRRITNRIELTSLSRPETRNMIRLRIESAGGKDIYPFTPNTIDYIYEQTGGFPREIIRLCSDLTEKAFLKKITPVDINYLRDDLPSQKISTSSLDELPERQRTILTILAKDGDMTPSEIINRIDITDYKDKDNAVRSVNNLLSRLMKDQTVERKKAGKKYKYSLSPKVKTLMVKS